MAKYNPSEAEVKLASYFSKFESLAMKILYGRKNFSKKWQKDASSLVFSNVISAKAHITRAKMIYPTTEEELKEKRNELKEAIISLDTVISTISFELTSPSDSVNTSRKNRIPVEVIEMVDYYQSIKVSLSKWIRHLKLMNKKGTFSEKFDMPLHTLNFVVYQDMENGRLIIHDLVNNKPHVYERGTYRISDDTDEIYIDDTEDDLNGKIAYNADDIHKLSFNN